MADFAANIGGKYQTFGELAGGSAVSILPTTSRGEWVSVGTTSFAAQMLMFNVVSNTAAGRISLDIGIGGAGAEVVLVSDIIAHFPRADQAGITAVFPIAIASGSVISVRGATSGGTAPAVGVTVMVGTFGLMGNQSFGKC